VRSFFAADYGEPDRVGAAPGPAGIRQRLAALHTTRPDLELVVINALVRGNLFVARRDIRGGREATFLGASLAATTVPWGPSTSCAASTGDRRAAKWWRPRPILDAT
jgi:hypothetical protein